MKHGSLNALSLLVLGLFLPNAPFRGHAAQTPPPNIILMMADDMGMGDTSAYQDFSGNDDSVQVHTPNMDRLARMGVRFTLANTPSSRCTTTRYSLLTGRYSWRSRMKHWVLFGAQGDPMIERDRPTIATMLHEAGYGTAIVGKWHVGLRFRQSDGRPAEGWKDADLTKPLYSCPLYAKDQQGILSDLGVLKRGQPLRLDTRPHLGVEAPGDWRMAGMTVRTLGFYGEGGR